MGQPNKETWKRNCPACGVELVYSSLVGWKGSTKNNSKCRQCTSKEIGAKISASLKGRKKSDEHRRKLSEARKGKPGHPMSAETKAKLIAAIKSKPRTPEHCKKLSEALKGKSHRGTKHSEETKQKLRAINLGKRHSEESKRKMSLARKGKKLGPFSDQHRANLSKACMGRKLSEETKRKLLASRKGVPLTEEHKNLIGQATKRLWEKEEFRRLMIGRKNSDETKAKMSKARKDRWADEEFRKSQTGRIMTEATKKKVSESKKALYLSDPDYHRRIREGQKRALKGRSVPAPTVVKSN